MAWGGFRFRRFVGRENRGKSQVHFVEHERWMLVQDGVVATPANQHEARSHDFEHQRAAQIDAKNRGTLPVGVYHSGEVSCGAEWLKARRQEDRISMQKHEKVMWLAWIGADANALLDLSSLLRAREWYLRKCDPDRTHKVFTATARCGGETGGADQHRRLKKGCNTL